MQEITKNIYIEDQFLGVTLGVIVTARGLIQIDAPPSPEDARCSRAWDSAWRLSAVTSVGLYHDWRERLRPRGSEVSEATAYVSVRLDPAWKLQLYGVKGFSDASPDFGAGLMVSRSY